MSNENTTSRCFVSYSGVKLPLKLVNPLDDAGLHNRITFFRGHYDTQDRLVVCEKVVYGEIEFVHRYEYHPNGTLSQAEITEADEEPRFMRFDEQGNLSE